MSTGTPLLRHARLCLSLQNKFDSKHALALWELCTDYLGSERDYGETPFIPLEQFRELMGAVGEKYSAFRDLNKYVIKEPVAEINSVSDFRAAIPADYLRVLYDYGLRQRSQHFDHPLLSFAETSAIR